jgi:hypothetical protein
MLFPTVPSATYLLDVMKCDIQFKELLVQCAGMMAALPCTVLRVDWVHSFAHKVLDLDLIQI